MIKWGMEYGVISAEKKGDIYYTVNWSPLSKADKYEIINKVPSVAGFFEIYWMDENNHLRMMVVGKANYSGLRAEIRRITDPELCKNNDKMKKILDEKEIWYRYCCSDSAKIIDDVTWFFMKTYFPERTDIENSGRYENIFLKESAPDKLLWVP